MRYIANPVEVDAEVIAHVGEIQPNGWLMVKLEDGNELNCNPGMIARIAPQPGDYVVTQSDGYVYLNPKEVFERKYRRADAPAARTMPGQVISSVTMP
jgi:translation initiation factor IF-1